MLKFPLLINVQCVLVGIVLVGKHSKAESNDLLQQLAQGLDDSPLVNSYAAAGGRALLPCDLSPPVEGDHPLLVLFSRGLHPIYSIDARDENVRDALHWTTEFQGRAFSFELDSAPQGLTISRVELEDEGDYHCRVDFYNSPTRNIRIRLHIAVPIRNLRIIDEFGHQINKTTRAIPLGSAIKLTCVVNGGKPRPKVTWWSEGMVIDRTIEDASAQTTINVLTLMNLTRSQLGKIVSCRATNSNLTENVEKSVKIDMTFPPRDLHFVGKSKILNEGKDYKLVCKSSGSRPPANITWYMSGEMISGALFQKYPKERRSISTLTFTPTRIQNGTRVACRAETPGLPPKYALETARVLIVIYPPTLDIRPGPRINMHDIKEGDDVYFECEVMANPAVGAISWFKNNEPLQQSKERKILISRQSLVLQNVSKDSTGEYVCRARNSVGLSFSKPFKLFVKYSPVCVPGQKEVYGGSDGKFINVTCELIGEPQPDAIYWEFNTSSEVIRLPESITETKFGRSTVHYIPESHRDFGSLLCWGENNIGKQKTPCVFQVVPASPPENVKNCSAWQMTSADGVLVVRCTPGWNGSLNQTFLLEVRSHPHKTLLYQHEQNTPSFSVGGLPPGTELLLTVASKNGEGKSTPVSIQYFTPIDIAEKQIIAPKQITPELNGNERLPNWNHVLSLGVGLGVLFSSILFVFIFIMRMKRNHLRSRSQSTTAVNETTMETVEDGGFDKRSPDVMLVTTDGIEVAAEETQLPSSTGPINDEEVRNKKKQQKDKKPKDAKKPHLESKEITVQTQQPSCKILTSHKPSGKSGSKDQNKSTTTRKSSSLSSNRRNISTGEVAQITTILSKAAQDTDTPTSPTQIRLVFHKKGGESSTHALTRLLGDSDETHIIS